jgi:hypothetical protein
MSKITEARRHVEHVMAEMIAEGHHFPSAWLIDLNYAVVLLGGKNIDPIHEAGTGRKDGGK